MQDNAYFAVLATESAEPFVVSAQSAEELAAELRKYYGTHTNVFVFQGWQWNISKGPTQRYLVGPAGQRIPLFHTEVNFEVDPSGSLYTRDEGT